MKKYIKIILFSVSIIVFGTGCFKDSESFVTNSKIENPWAKLQQTSVKVVGEVIDEKGNPVANADVAVGNQTVKTDKNGVFLIQKVDQCLEHIYAKVTKTGYFTGSRSMIGTAKAVNRMQIMLMQKEQIKSINSTDGGIVNVDKLTINFPKNGYIDAKGTIYTGKVNVAAKYLDVRKQNTLLQMPGDLRGVDTKNQINVLGSYGMVACELTDDKGNALNLGNGAEAEITFPILKEVMAQRPNDMPLWHFDETIGVWAEEGTSKLVGDNYVGKVSHFSFWNCDFPFPYIKFETTLKDQNGNPIANTVVYLTVQNPGVDSVNNFAAGMTNVDGYIGGCVPKDKIFKLQVKDPQCAVIIYEQTIGPFSQNTVFPPIVVTIQPTAAVTYKVSGKLLDCAGAPLATGYAIVDYYTPNNVIYRSQVVFTDANGNFDSQLFVSSYCNSIVNISSVCIKSYDPANLKESDVKTFPIQKGTNAIGDINICNTIDEYFSYQYNGKTTIFKDYTATLDSLNGNISIMIQDNTSKSVITLIVKGVQKPFTPGTYLTNPSTSVLQDSGKYFYVDFSNNPPTYMIFTKTANKIGEYNEGSFTLSLLEEGSNPKNYVNFPFTFRYKRK